MLGTVHVDSAQSGETMNPGGPEPRTSCTDGLKLWLRSTFASGDAPAQRNRPSPALDEGIVEKVSATQRYRASKWTPRTIRRALLCGERPPPIPSYTGLVENPEPGKIGIACSGGGIRSAAFNLGALQALQDAGVLNRARYLAGVSGGSYIAAAFCMVRKTWPRGPRPEKPDQGWDDSNPDLIEGHPPFFRGSPEEQYLRNRSSYLAPGAFGKIRFGYRLLLGMGINLLFIALAVVVLGALLALVYGAVYPRLIVEIVHGGLCNRLLPLPGHGMTYRHTLCQILPMPVPSAVWRPIAAIATVGVISGVAAIVAFRWSAFTTQVVEVWSLRLFLLAVAAGTLLIGLPLLLSLYRAWGTVTAHATLQLPGGVKLPPPRSPPGGTSTTTLIATGTGGAATVGGAVLLQLRADVAQAQQLMQSAGRARRWYAKLAPSLRTFVVYAIAAVIGPLLTLALLLETMSLVLNSPHDWVRWTVAGAGLAGFSLVYWFADMTSWSLHSFYRRRLCSAFALKRVELKTEEPPDPPISSVNAGEAEARNHRRLVQMSETAIPAETDGGQSWPTLLVCAAANISDSEATPPGRAVTSFTFSATAMGGPLVGAVRTRELEAACDDARKRYFTLPAAVAMSGAALSPSMGKMTRGPLRFLMGLANVRLGVWVPNPRRLEDFQAAAPDEQAGKDERRLARALRWLIRPARRSHYPRPRPLYLLRELLGMNPLNGNYLYVTDGGHYENLGLVELLRRGCTEIYCFDASNDNFDAVGDAVALARSELDIEVELDCKPLEVDASTRRASTDCVEGTIKYPNSNAPSARLLYARLAMTPGAPPDVVAYQRKDPRFPHDPTTDQLYTDQRFEAYRALGSRAAHTALAAST